MPVCAAASDTAPGSTSVERPTHTNRLIHSASPYLLAHAHDPVDWYPWGDEALEKARRENKPIFLSIGYSTCYWCHVAQRTLFSDPEIAALMNEWFVSIKVDREERPDLDAVYLLATQLLTGGRGGWPNNVFLTPDLKPFYAGGYFAPQDDDFGRPGFPAVLRTLHNEWIEHARKVSERAEGVASVMRQIKVGNAAKREASFAPTQWLTRAREATLKRADPEYGGLGGAHSTTKFPQSPLLQLMLTDYERTRDGETLAFLTTTLDAMAFGGIHDQLGGGFHRYSIERTWSIPHFEKMLYDNAQLLSVYCRAYALTGNALYRGTAEDVRDYLRNHLAAPSGGFYTAEDAAVDGEEGASYRWTRAQIDALLELRAADFWAVYALTPIPEEIPSLEPDTAPGVLRVRTQITDASRTLSGLGTQRRVLLSARDARPQPARDEKMIVGLNGLAIDAFVASARALRSPQDLVLAKRSADTIWSLAWDPASASLKHQIFQGHAQGEGYLDDYALLGRAFLSLHGATGEAVWLKRAKLVSDSLLARFEPNGDGALATTVDREHLIIAPPEDGDDAYPSGTSAAVDVLSRLAIASGKKAYADAALRIVRDWSARQAANPQLWPTLVASLGTYALPLPAAPKGAAPMLLGTDRRPRARNRRGAARGG